MVRRGFTNKEHLREFKGFFVVTKDDFDSREGSCPVVVFEAQEVEEVITLLQSIAFSVDEWPKLQKVFKILVGGKFNGNVAITNEKTTIKTLF